MTVREIYDTMAYGAAPESAEDADAWLVDRGDRLGPFTDGAPTEPRERRGTRARGCTGATPG